MSWSFAVDLALVGLLLAIALFMSAVRNSFAAVISFAAYGLLVGVAWVRLQAVDVALTEVALGSGVVGVLMIGAAGQLRSTKRAAPPASPGLPLRLGAALLAATVAVALGVSVWHFAEPAPTLAPVAMAEIGATGLGNPVTAVLMAYRATDTLLEKVVLVLAVVGVWSLAPDSAWGGRPGALYRADPDGVLPFFARMLPPFGVIVGGSPALGERRRARQRVRGWHRARGDVGARDDGGARGRTSGQAHLAASRSARRTGGVRRGRTLGDGDRGGLPGLPGRLTQSR